jgi:hypothetical protein
MTNQHPITPPPEMVEEWVSMLEYHSDEKVFSEVAQWGADQELEACCSEVSWNGNKALAAELRTRRRPKPLSLKEQALAELQILRIDANTHGLGFDAPAIRRALETLDD